MQDKMRPVHPGEILREDVLAPLGMSARQFASVLGVPANRVSQILAAERAVTADTALRIARLLGGTPDFWLRLQVRYDLKMQQTVAGSEIAREVKPLSRKVLAAAGAGLDA
ncbi:MAG TPA: HigA family addiction module antitoxin [Verrucomicrobiae bacterium]|jgi:addiction module HigA family antidote|nr:HigA family addiction module antitoxin [Verrucomicrobiae bacterium]